MKKEILTLGLEHPPSLPLLPSRHRPALIDVSKNLLRSRSSANHSSSLSFTSPTLAFIFERTAVLDPAFQSYF